MPEITIQLIAQIIVLLIYIKGAIDEFSKGISTSGVVATSLVFTLFYLAGAFTTILPYPW